LADANIPHVIIGGLAVSQLSRPRLTADIDVLAYLDNDSRIPSLIESAGNAGFSLRIQKAETFARKNNVLLLSHDQSKIPVDISLGVLPFEREVIQRSSRIAAGNLQLLLPSVEDLVILKAVTHRAVDLRDITALVQAHPRLDRERIERIVEEKVTVADSGLVAKDLHFHPFPPVTPLLGTGEAVSIPAAYAPRLSGPETHPFTAPAAIPLTMYFWSAR
jgi:hypothetical protein